VARLQEKETRLLTSIQSVQTQLQESEKQKSTFEERSKQIPDLQQKVQKLETDLNDEKAHANTLNVELRAIRERTEEEKKGMNEKFELLQQAEKNLSTVFENTANKIFEKKQQQFKEQSKESLTTTIDPLKKEFEQFKKRIEEINTFDTKERQSIADQIKNMTESSLKMSQEAQNLTDALKGNKKVQGNWGEVQLERILEQSSLQKDREYSIQKAMIDEEGKRRIPDVIIHLPEKKDLVIDSKVSLVDYEKYCTEEDEELRNQALKRHIDAVKKHISDLNVKAYEKLEGVRTLDFVFIFIPIEPAYLLVVQQDPSVINKAFEKNIIVVSPTTLIPTLRIVHNIWQYERQNKNTEAIAKQAGAMHDKFVGFLDSMEGIGKSIEKTNSVYQAAFKQLKEGKGNLISRAEKIKQLGAKTGKSLSEDILEQTDDLEDITEAELLTEQ
ncbi:DNA recombination protein RmuC, partial [bacterium]|nr:DNA recombination protein RmuC [bacterium]